MAIKFPSIPPKRLNQSITSASTSFKLDDILGFDGVALTSAMFGDQAWAIFRNENGTIVEIMEFTPSTIASASITIVKRGLEFTGTSVEVTANKLNWPAFETVVQIGTDAPQVFQYLKDYIDGIAVAGSPVASLTAKGLVELPTQAEVRARTAAGATGAPLAMTPDVMPNVLISDYVADTGAANAYVITPVPAIAAYVAGQQFTFKATSANTGASTLNVSALGVKTIKKLGSSTDLVANDILAGQIVLVEYDGTQFQMLSGLGNALTAAAVVASVTGPVVNTYTSNGTWTKPAGLRHVIVELVGGGGGGGGHSAAGQCGGGGGGGYVREKILAATLGATETVTIGAAGAGGSSATGTAGGNTTFGALATGSGGAAGVGGAGGPHAGGNGGAASGGDLNIPGQYGGSATTTLAGYGGSSLFGFGGRGLVGTGSGNPGEGYGSGGSGAFSAAGGGSGTAGIMIVTEYYI